MKCSVPFRKVVGADKNYLMVASTRLSLWDPSFSPFPLCTPISLQSERFRNLTERGIVLTLTGMSQTNRAHRFLDPLFDLDSYKTMWYNTLSDGINIDHACTKKSELVFIHTVKKSRMSHPEVFSIYNGQMREDSNGRETFSNAWSFVGTFVAMVRAGRGKLTSPDGNSWYGTWENGKRTNKIGKLKLSNGESYSGMWPQDAPFITTTELERKDASARKIALSASQYLTFNPPYTAIESILVEKSGYDRIVSLNGEIVLRKASAATIASVNKLFASTNPAKLGVGRDSANYIGPRNADRYHQVVPIEVFDVDYSKNNLQRKWERSQANHFNRMAYCITKKGADMSSLQKSRRQDAGRGELKDAPDSAEAEDDDPMYVHTRLDRLPGLASQGVNLEGDINEKFLLHGTTAETILPMLLEGPTNRYTRGGAFGKAVYFAEDVGKSDQYCKIAPFNYPDAGPDGFLKRMLGIEPKQYEDAAVSARGNKDVFYMFVIRVALGCPAIVNAEDYWSNRSGKQGTPAHNQRLFFEPNTMTTSPNKFPGFDEAYKLDRQFQSVVIDNWGQNHPLNMRYREFMVYNGFVAKITHLVAYKRLVTWPVSVPRMTTTGGMWNPHPFHFDQDPVLDYIDPLDKANWKVPAVDPAKYNDIDVDFEQVLGDMQEDKSSYLPPAPVSTSTTPQPAGGSSSGTPNASTATSSGQIVLASKSSASSWSVVATYPDKREVELISMALKPGKLPSITDILMEEREQACVDALTSGTMSYDALSILRRIFRNRFWKWQDAINNAKHWPRNATKRLGRKVPETDVVHKICADIALRHYVSFPYEEDVVHVVAVLFCRNASSWQDSLDRRYKVKRNLPPDVPKRVYDKYLEASEVLKDFYKSYHYAGLDLEPNTSLSQIKTITF